MTIESIGPIDSVPNIKKTQKSGRPEESKGSDSIYLSAEAKSKAELYQALELAKMAPEVRRDRVEEVKQKLQDPSYINNQVIEELADRLMDLFGIS